MMKKVSMLMVSIIAIVSEILPYGAVCVFMEDGGAKIRQTYSYFDLTPYGYANFSPFVTAVLSCVACILCILFLKINNNIMQKAITIIAGSSTVISVTPVFYGVEYMTVVGVCVTLSMLILFVLSMIRERKE